MSYDLGRIAVYIDTLSKNIGMLCENQTQIHRAYNRCLEQWNDGILNIVSQALKDTERKVLEEQEELVDFGARLNEKYSAYTENYLEEPWTARFEKSSVEEKLKEFTMMGRLTVATTADGIKRFEDALGVYLENNETVIRQIKRDTQEISGHWSNEDYKVVAGKIDEFCSYLQTNINGLEELRDYVRKKREIQWNFEQSKLS
ncbi:MAG: hypothetical protein IJD75_07630 [Clostridia bacterium]|nr:hypothetical protein [Clostridia bacterium]MBQ3014986.1 hypothetical protein [Clostridia bacterium]